MSQMDEHKMLYSKNPWVKIGLSTDFLCLSHAETKCYPMTPCRMTNWFIMKSCRVEWMTSRLRVS